MNSVKMTLLSMSSRSSADRAPTWCSVGQFLLGTLIFSLSRSHVMLVSSLIIVLQCTGIVIYLLGTIFHPLNNSVAAQPVWKHTCMSLIHFSAGMLDLHTSSAFQPKCTSFTSMALNRLFNNMSGWKKTCRLE